MNYSKEFNQTVPRWSRINWSHPLSRGLIRAWLFNNSGKGNVTHPGGYVASDVVTDDRVNYSRNATDTGYLFGPHGIEFAVGADGGGTATFLATRILPIQAHSVSVAAGWRIGTPNGTIEDMFGNANNGNQIINMPQGSGTGFVFGATSFNGGGGTNLGIMFCCDGSGLATGSKGSGTLTTKTYYDVVGTYLRDPAITTYGGTWKVYTNGVQDGTSNNFSVAGSFAGTFTPAIPRVLWGQGTDVSDKFGRYLYVWKDRVLTSAEVASLAGAPFQFFETSYYRRYFFYGVQAAAGATDTDSYVFGGW